jgi:hypothetical protein
VLFVLRVLLLVLVEGEEVFDAVPVAGERLGPATAVHRPVQLLMRLEQRRRRRQWSPAEGDGAAANLIPRQWHGRRLPRAATQTIELSFEPVSINVAAEVTRL